MKKLYDLKEVSRILAISEGQVRYLDRIGLISPRQRDKGGLLFDFEGLLALRTVKVLRSQGVSLRRLRYAAEKLKKVNPEAAQPLTGARLNFTGGQLVITRAHRRFNPEGQLFLDFAPPVGSPIPLNADALEEMFFQALAWEEERWEEAERKYGEILAIKPDHADSLVNLGNLRHRAGDREAAQARYREALQINPDHVEANYNLAHIFEEQRDWDNAIRFYRKTIHEDPEFADAYFNLARILERRGDKEEADRLWRRYLNLD